jgi:hypothetical protein
VQQVVIARIIHLSHPVVAARTSHFFEGMSVFRDGVAEEKKGEKKKRWSFSNNLYS